MSGAEVPQDSFAVQLGEVLALLADQHPKPDDESVIRFIGTNESGATGISSCFPRQFAIDVLQRTPQGLHTIEFYRKTSENLGDPTGQRVIDDLRDMLVTQE